MNLSKNQIISASKVIAAILFVLLLSSSQNGRAQQTVNPFCERISDFKSLKAEFLNPASKYGTLPFFVWNGKITKAEIDEKMQDFKNKGCGGVIVHARNGLVTEYNSPEWYELFDYTVAKGKELGMTVWIYDENGYPSGFGGGLVPEAMPESYNQGLGLQPTESEEIPADYKKYYLILKEVNGKFENITDKINTESGIRGRYVLYAKTFFPKSERYGGYSYVDLLHPGVTEKFIEVTMTGYEKYSGKEFGKTVPGVFTDEPRIGSSGGLRWTSDLFEVFEKQWGYDLKVNLPSLYKKVGDWKKVRHNYTKTLLWLYIERWAKPLSKYYNDRNLTFTGHYWEHKWPSMTEGGDNMAMYAYHSVPAVDMIFNQFDEESTGARFGNIRASKELSSVANQFGRSRTLSEAYGGCGWEMTFKDLKRLGDWAYALGINLMNQHLSYFTMVGPKKYDYPPSFSYHNPWWKSYGYLNEYYARLSLALSGGVQKNDLLIIEPTTSAWLYDSYLNSGIDENLGKIGTSFQRFVATLEKSQIEYDLGSEDILENHGAVIENKLKVGNCAYHTVIIPPLTENLNQKTFELIKGFVAKGGQLIAFSSPGLIEGNYSAEALEFFKQKKSNLTFIPELNADFLNQLTKKQDIQLADVKGGKLYHQRRQLDDGQIVFLVNSDQNEKTTGQLTISGKDALVLDAFSGKIEDYQDEPKQDKINLKFSLNPAESLLLYISNEKLNQYKAADRNENLSLIAAGSGLTIKKVEPNALPIDFCTLKIKGKELKDIHVFDAAKEVYMQHGFPNGDPWNVGIQFKTKLIDQDHFPEGSGFDATYHFNVAEKFDWSGLKLVVERPELWSVAVNGKFVKPQANDWWLDHANKVFAVGDLIHLGINEVTLHCSPMKIYAEVEPVYILGEFSLSPAEKGWTIQSPSKEIVTGSWKNQGLPFYSWDMSYIRNFDIKSNAGYYEVGLGEWKGTVAELFVNDKHAGTFVLPADLINVSELMQEGKNKVEVRITGSLKNLLGPHYNKPLPGRASPKEWQNIKGPKPGSDYELFDYGLSGNINLYTKP